MERKTASFLRTQPEGHLGLVEFTVERLASLRRASAVVVVVAVAVVVVVI